MGRKTGRRYAVPVAYTRSDGSLLNRIRLDRDGNPAPEDLELAWAAGAGVAVLTPLPPSSAGRPPSGG